MVGVSLKSCSGPTFSAAGNQYLLHSVCCILPPLHKLYQHSGHSFDDFQFPIDWKLHALLLQKRCLTIRWPKNWHCTALNLCSDWIVHADDSMDCLESYLWCSRYLELLQKNSILSLIRRPRSYCRQRTKLRILKVRKESLKNRVSAWRPNRWKNLPDCQLKGLKRNSSKEESSEEKEKIWRPR